MDEIGRDHIACSHNPLLTKLLFFNPQLLQNERSTSEQTGLLDLPLTQEEM